MKAVARHQQYRAAEKAVRRLLTGRARAGRDTDDERGGVIWHTQGSGKSLTMTFLVRRVHLHHRISEFMVVLVTDRTQLQTQLSRTLKLSESDNETAKTRTQMEGLLRDGGRRVVVGMIHQCGSGFTFAADAEGSGDDRDLVGESEEAGQEQDEPQGPRTGLPPVQHLAGRPRPRRRGTPLAHRHLACRPAQGDPERRQDRVHGYADHHRT